MVLVFFYCAKVMLFSIAAYLLSFYSRLCVSFCCKTNFFTVIMYYIPILLRSESEAKNEIRFLCARVCRYTCKERQREGFCYRNFLFRLQ